MREYSCSLLAKLELKLSANEMEIIYGVASGMSGKS